VIEIEPGVVDGQNLEFKEAARPLGTFNRVGKCWMTAAASTLVLLDGRASHPSHCMFEHWLDIDLIMYNTPSHSTPISNSSIKPLSLQWIPRPF